MHVRLQKLRFRLECSIVVRCECRIAMNRYAFSAEVQSQEPHIGHSIKRSPTLRTSGFCLESSARSLMLQYLFISSTCEEIGTH